MNWPLGDLQHNEVFIGFCRHLDVDCAAKVAERGDITEAAGSGLADEKSRLLSILGKLVKVRPHFVILFQNKRIVILPFYRDVFFFGEGFTNIRLHEYDVNTVSGIASMAVRSTVL